MLALQNSDVFVCLLCYVLQHVVVLLFFFFFLMIRRPPRSTQSRSSAASDVYKRQGILFIDEIGELHPTQMNKLLKVLEDRKVMLESAYYNENDKNIPAHIHDIFNNGLPADFRLVGATTRMPDELPPALRSRCMEVFFSPLDKGDIRIITLNAANKIKCEITPEALEDIIRYATNGREAVNMIQLAAGIANLMAELAVGIDADDLAIDHGLERLGRSGITRHKHEALLLDGGSTAFERRRNDFDLLPGRRRILCRRKESHTCGGGRIDRRLPGFEILHVGGHGLCQFGHRQICLALAECLENVWRHAGVAARWSGPLAGDGAAGLDVTSGEHLLTGDDRDSMVAALEFVIQEDATWETLSRNGRDLIRRRYVPEVAFGALDEALRSS